MSFWLKLGVQINDLACFRQSCEQNGVEFIENEDPNFKSQGYKVHAILRDTQPGNFARREGFLVEKGGGFAVILDNDPGYSSLTNRLGRNGGRLTRDYTAGVVQKSLRAAGGMLAGSVENPDGSLTLKVRTLR